MTDDLDLMRDLATTWTTHDPVPADLADRSLVALALEDVDAEYELLTLAGDAGFAGVRALPPGMTIAPPPASALPTAAHDELTSKLEFTNGRVRVVLRVASAGPGRRRIDGWVSPADDLVVRLRQVSPGRGPATVETRLDDGRFEFVVDAGGVARVWLRPAPGEHGRTFATALFEV
ncbi:MAG: hypothetical protein ACR2K3_11440 [Nocardioides sp.]